MYKNLMVVVSYFLLITGVIGFVLILISGLSNGQEFTDLIVPLLFPSLLITGGNSLRKYYAKLFGEADLEKQTSFKDIAN